MSLKITHYHSYYILSDVKNNISVSTLGMQYKLSNVVLGQYFTDIVNIMGKTVI